MAKDGLTSDWSRIMAAQASGLMLETEAMVAIVRMGAMSAERTVLASIQLLVLVCICR